MAKIQIREYSFKPGLSYLSNSRPNAYDLILANKTYLKKEVIAFLNAQVTDSTKCARDLGYIIDGLSYDVALGTNYNSLFIGLTEYNSLEITNTVIRQIERTETRILALSAVSSDATATSRVAAYYNEVIDIAQNGRNNADALSVTNPSNATASRIAAKNRLIANKNFLAAEVNAWVGLQYPSHDHDVAKCTRDVKYAIDAMIYDILYGGNSATYDQAKFFFYFDNENSPGIDPTHRAQTYQAYLRLRTIVSQVVLGTLVTKTTTGTTPNNLTQDTTGSNADAGDAAVLQALVDITANVVNAVNKAAADAYLATITKTFPDVTWAAAGIQSAKTAIDSNKNTIIADVNAFASYVFNTEKCERDTGYVIDAYLFDLRYTGNEETRRVASKYWVGEVPQIDGNRIVEIEAHLFLRDVINTYILTNTAAPSYQAVVSQSIIPAKVSEATTTTRVTELAGLLTSVIEFGLSVLPAEVTGVGRLKFPKKYEQNQILLITNTTRNEIIYDFSDPTAGAVREFIRDESDIFPRLLEWAQGYTQLTLYYNTSTHATTDSIQIFVDENELRTRPYQFGTDAMERMRMAAPQAMLDADFEYGLQPTKWQAIATTRGYPSTYEIPGSDILVTSVTTNASSGTNSIGPSIITVNTVSPHFLSIGTPFSIKALASSVTGFSRAEGTFLVNTTPSPISFTYFSKSRVGTTDGEVLSTSYTQLRVAGFYTGANIGGPSFSVVSQGNSGTMTVLLNYVAGENTIAFSGNAPAVGDPIVSVSSNFNATSSGTTLTVSQLNSGRLGIGQRITGGSIPANTFIVNQRFGATGDFDVSITATGTSGTNTLTVASSSGIIVGQLLSGNGALLTGTVIGTTVTNVSGTTITLSQNLTGNISTTVYFYTIGGTGSYTTNQAANLLTQATVSGSSFTIGTQVSAVRGSGGTVVTAYAANNVEIGQTQFTLIDGTGVQPGHLIDNGSGRAMEVSSVAGNIVSFLSGRTTRLVGSNGSYSNLSGTSIVSNGSGALINLITNVSNQYTLNPSYPFVFDGENYSVNDTLKISGDQVGIYTDTKLLAKFNIPEGRTFGSTLDAANIVNGSVPFQITGSFSFDVKKFGRTSLNLENNLAVSTGAAEFVKYGQSSDYNTTGPFCFEIQIYPRGFRSTAGSKTFIVDRRETSNTEPGWYIYINENGYLVFGDGAAGDVITGSTAVTLNDWSHVAITRGAGELKLWLNGVQQGSTVIDNNNYLFSSPIMIGADWNSENAYDGYIDEARLRVASTRTAAFSPPTVEFAADSYGTTPANDITFRVATISSGGAIATISNITGTPPVLGGNFYIHAATAPVQIPIGSGATFNVSRSNGNYTSISISQSGSNYLVSNFIRISESLLDGGGDPERNLILAVTGINAGGAITSVSAISGTARSLGDPIAFLSSIDISDNLPATLVAGRTMTFSAIAKIAVTFPNAHGLTPGASISVNMTSAGTNHSLCSGPFFVEEVPSKNVLRYAARSSGVVATSPPLVGIVYPRTDAFFLHRPFDGGVLLSTGTPSHGAQAIRMSKKYIRYQSGKGAMYTTGALFAPSYDVRSITAEATAVNSLITITIDDNDHGLQIKSDIRISGVITTGYNGDYQVVEIVDERVFRVRALTQLGSTTAEIGAQCQMAHTGWHGAYVRAGAFDDQNGIFFEYNGDEMAVVRRSSTFQLAGTVSISVDSNLVTGSNTRFRDQLQEGDRIIIRGMTHLVTDVVSQTQMTVNPDFRGVVNVTNAKICLIQDYRITQSEWNLDKCDGTGPSGYILDVTKMQMIGLQYSWYGAGFIDWMFRGPNGDYVFAHRLKGNNLNTEAYMRTGNLPVRYEVINEGARSKLASTITSTDTTLIVRDGKFFPDSGTVYCENELISYTSKSGNALGGLTRATSYVNFSAGAQRTFTAGTASSHPINSGVVLVSTTASPLISHWGSAYIMDGRFDTDRGYIFNYQVTNLSVTNIKTTAFAIRLAPSVSNAITGDLGERELLNRAQLLLNSLEIVGGQPGSADSFIIEGVLNPLNYPTNPADAQWFGLTSTAQGGQPSFAQVVNGSGITFVGASQVTATPTQTWENSQNRRTTAVFTSADVTNVRLGFVVTATVAGLQAGTVVQAIAVNSPGNNQTTITISKPATATVTGVITFTAPVYAQPGEQVFAFAAPQGVREVLDLSELKELTSTAIGGRGTFPNGPDVLAINVYTTGTAAVTANLILRWGEAQA